MDIREDDCSASISSVVSDYMSKRLQEEGFSWQISPTRNRPSSEVTKVACELCKEFRKRYEDQFNDMCKVCLHSELCADNYYAVLGEVLQDGIHWGRVVAILTYAGEMAVYSLKQGRTHEVDMIYNWTCSFMSSRVENWINKNNGWKGLVDFKNKSQQKEKKNGWGSVLLGGALGAMALGALIVNRT